ncbi:MAG TPA: VOC family protein [Steroidobacteraceae bacterium]|nr:VOC family protein [Steroidobacteraceae bacterium]
MIDHTGLNVSDYAKSKAFYLAALAPLGYQVIKELPAQLAPEGAVGLGVPPKSDFWIAGGKPQSPPLHVAFRAESRTQVDAFYKAAMAAGGRDNGAPGIRAHYHPNYYGAFVLDPDGHNIEAVCHHPA